MAEIEVDVNLEALAWTLGRTLTTVSLTEFVLHLDEARADLDFTKGLYAALRAGIEEEENNE